MNFQAQVSMPTEEIHGTPSLNMMDVLKDLPNVKLRKTRTL
jgi:hypothetical protein